MTVKIKTITLTSGWGDISKPNVTNYRVEKVTDSIEFSPQDMLSKDTVEGLCHSRDWKVTVVKHEK